MTWLLIQREEGIFLGMDGPFDIATVTLTSQSFLYLSSCDCTLSKDLCCETIKTRSLLGKEVKEPIHPFVIFFPTYSLYDFYWRT